LTPAPAGALCYRDRCDLKEPAGKLGRATIVDSREAPSNVVTMNSQVRLRDLDTNGETVFALAFPGDADIGAGRLSVFSPIGTAILGCSAGETIETRVPAGRRRGKIEEMLYQPEAAGDYHL
jgi:regulator of nucleoside diphosphate kinase